ncbi:MAG TPA: DUF4381 domain-containing protein [Urbifossiella sp.]|jgi:uncharacterized protein YjiS (DUF1127 family)|nr:DUF4381 domain-containing protein [Urbifossiella sp.]
MSPPAVDPGSLDLLHDIVLPPPVPWWPPAPGWYAVGAVALGLLGAAAWTAVTRWHRNRYRRAALRELDRLPATGNRVPAIAAVLKRTALAAYPRERVASLTGAAWLAFLDRTGGTAGFTTPPGNALGDAEYTAGPTPPPADVTQLFDLARHWVRHHRTARPC